MANKFITILLACISLPCFAYDCINSSEYNESVEIAKKSHRELENRVSVGVDFLMQTKGINFDQALKEFMERGKSPEALTYDEALKKLGEKIQAFKTQSPENCAYLIKLQREYEKIGNKKIEFVVNEILTQPVPNTNDINVFIK